MNDFHFAVVVGIAEYPGINNLSSAQRDAQSFYDWLVGEGGVPSKNIRRVRSTGPFRTVTDGKPTRTEINNALREVNAALRESIKSNPLDWEKTRLYFYVSGHGVAPDGSEAALLMANAGDDAPENIPCAAYLRRYEKCQIFREVVVFADCCRLARAVEFEGPPFLCGEVNIGTVNGFLGFATQLGDLAYEPKDDPNGDEARSYFTQALLEGLSGAAANEMGEINSVTLSKYTTERTKVLTEHKRYKQIPKMPVDLEAPIVFRTGTRGATPAKPKRKVTITSPAGFAGTVELLDAALQRVATHDPAAGIWKESLEDGLYEVRPINAPDGKIFKANGLFRVLGEDRDVQL